MDAERDMNAARAVEPRAWALWTLCALFVAYGLAVAFAPVNAVLGRFLVDDSLYYYGIARHVAAGDGSVFDGINPTNGYHPLWMLVLTPVFRLISDPVAAFHAALLLQTVLLAAALRLLLATGRTLGLSPAGRGAAVIAAGCPLFFHLWVNGLESTLLAVFILAALRQYMRVRGGEADSAGGRAALGLFCGLAFLSRLDSAFLPVTIIAVESVQWLAGLVRRRAAAAPLRRAIWVAAMMLLVGGPYLLRNLLVFGHVMPISGYMKTPAASGEAVRFGVQTGGVLWPARRLAGSLGLPTAAAAAIMGVLLLVLIALAVRAARKQTRDGESRCNRGVLAALGAYLLYTAAHYLYVALAMPGVCNTMWYYVPAILGLSLVIGLIVSGVAPAALSGRAAATLLALGLLAAGGGAAYRFTRDNSFHQPKLAAAAWIIEHLPGRRGAAFDAGIVGYFSGGRVVNLDGLVNNLELKDYAERGRLNDYLRDKQVDYVVQYASENPAGKRRRWLDEELGDALGEILYQEPYGPRWPGVSMYVYEVRR